MILPLLLSRSLPGHKTGVVLLLCLFCWLSVSAQLLPFNTEAGWGFLNQEGKVAIAPRFQFLLPSPYSDPSVERYLAVQDSLVTVILGAQVIETPFQMVEYAYRRAYRQSRGMAQHALTYQAGQALTGVPITVDHGRGFDHLTLHGDSLHLLLHNGKVLYQSTDSFSLVHLLRGVYRIEEQGRQGLWLPQQDLFLPPVYRSVVLTNRAGYPVQFSCQHEKEVEIWSLEGKKLVSLARAFPDSLSPPRINRENYLEFPDNSGVLWGLMRINGDTLVFPQYDPGIRHIWEHYFRVTRNRNLGLLDSTGKVLLKPVYQGYVQAPGGQFWVEASQGWALTDSLGQLLTPAVFADPGQFLGPVAVVSAINDVRGAQNTTVKVKQYGLINRYGEVLAEPIYDGIQVLETVARLKRGERLSQVSFYPDGRFDPRKKIIVVQEKERQGKDSTQIRRSYNLPTGWYRANNNLWGLRDSLGKLLLRPSFTEYETFPELGLTRVKQRVEGSNREQVGLVAEQKGELLLAPQLTHLLIEDFYQAPVARGIYSSGYFLLVNRRGAMRRLGRISYLGEFQDGAAIAQSDGEPVHFHNDQFPPPPPGGKWGVLKTNGKWQLEPVYQALSEFHQGLALAKKQDQWGVINPKGQWVLPATHDSLYVLPGLPDSAERWYVSMEYQNRYYFRDEQNELLFRRQYTDCFPFSASKARFQDEAEWGWLDTAGREGFRRAYRALGDVHDNRAYFQGQRYFGYLNSAGDTLIPLQYYKARDFVEGRAAVREKYTWGYIDTLGQWLLKPKYTEAGDFQQGQAIVKKKGKWGVIDAKGKWFLKAKYSHIERWENDYVVKYKGQRYRSDVEGNLRPFQLADLPQPPLKTRTNWTADTLHFRQLQFQEELAPTEGRQIGLIRQQVGLVNQQGETILSPEYESIQYVSGLVQVVQDGRIGYFSPQGYWVWKPW